MLFIFFHPMDEPEGADNGWSNKAIKLYTIVLVKARLPATESTKS